MERKYERKEWSKLYEHRAQVLLKEKEDPASNRARRDLQMITKAGTLIARKIGKRVRIKLKNKAFSCHRTPENLTFPKGLRDWSTHWGTQLMCSICQTPCFYDSTNCKTCNAIAHRLCVAEQLVLSGSISQMSSLSMGSEHKAAADDDDDDEDEDGEPDAEDAVFGEGQEGEDNFLATLSALGTDEYNCMDCHRGYQEDVDYFDKLKVKLTRGRRLVLAMRLVCRRILCYIERKRFKKLRKGLILIQSGIRKRRAKRVFFHWRRSQMRVIVIDVLHLPLGAIKENDLVVLTAVDPMKNQQLFRIDKDASRAIDEGFLIPGITSHMTVVITLCRVEEHTANTVFVIQEQCQLSLRDIDEFLLKLPYALPFGKRIWWHPTDPKKDFPYRIVTEKTGGIVSGHSSTSANHSSGLDYAAIAKPSSPFALGEREHKQHRDAKSAGGDVSAPDQASGGCSKSGFASGAVTAEHKSLYVASPSPSRGHSPAAGSLRHGLINEGLGGSSPHTPHSPCSISAAQQADTAKSSHYVRVLYAPQNPISSMVVTISGPPLDVLRAPAVIDVHQLARIQKNKSDGDSSGKLDTHDQGPQGRATRWWLCLNNLRLYFYQNHGDIRPRFVSDIVEAQVVVDRTYTKGNVVSVLHHDSRLWLLELGEAKLADKFVFAVTESQKAHAQPQGSIFMRTSDVRKHRTFGFDFI